MHNVSPYDARVIQQLNVCASVVRLDDSSDHGHVQLQVMVWSRLWIMPQNRPY